MGPSVAAQARPHRWGSTAAALTGGWIRITIVSFLATLPVEQLRAFPSSLSDCQTPTGWNCSACCAVTMLCLALAADTADRKAPRSQATGVLGVFWMDILSVSLSACSNAGNSMHAAQCMQLGAGSLVQAALQSVRRETEQGMFGMRATNIHLV
ncbi:hypothetical protein CRENBAI_012561 [Crenichthys baileyi]|uniref:Uncharacterized protein n=1 Tax=Crenichthys baileyi TaxID=28760 RepID=A0AAV9RFH0_9TELE